MVKKDKFPHIELRLTREETAKPASGGPPKNPKTKENSANRQGHGKKLKKELQLILSKTP